MRLAYFTAYNSSEDYMYGVANIATWTMIECGTGIAGGSIATFRPLLRLIPFLGHTSYAEQSGPMDGASRSQQLDDLSRSHTLAKKSRHEPDGSGDQWERSDAESQKHILKETTIEFTHEDHAVPDGGHIVRQIV